MPTDALSPLVIFLEKTPEDHTWFNTSFTVYPQEKDFGGFHDRGEGSVQDLQTCGYVANGIMRSRVCNAPFQVTVGPSLSNNCSVQGANNPQEGPGLTCALQVYAVDQAGNETAPQDRPSRFYGIDFTPPVVGKISLAMPGENHISVVHEKESRVVGCNLFVKEGDTLRYEDKGSMKISVPCERDCKASLSYQLRNPGEYSIQAVCQDAAGNYGFGDPLEVSLHANQPPEITSCRVVPVTGSTATEFHFEVYAKDLESDPLVFLWDFGDQATSSQALPLHHYAEKGTYTPQVTVSDGRGSKTTCSTPWVVVEE